MLNSSSRQIVVGDVHGHYKGLKALLALLQLSDCDTVYFLGDLIDRGPDSAQVVEFVRAQGYLCLMGNHEQMMLTAFSTSDTNRFAMEAWLAAGGRSTLESYADANQLNVDLEWMATLPPYLDLGNLWLVHAGVDPRFPIEEQTSQEFCWIRKDFHQMSRPFFEDKLIISGHTITFTLPGVKPGQVAKGAGWIDIDTGAYHPKSGWMTALDATERKVYQVNVFDGSSRIRPYSEAVTPIQFIPSEEPPRATTHHRKKLFSMG